MSLACGRRRRQRHLQRGWTVASNLLQRYRKQGWLNLSTDVGSLVLELLMIRLIKNLQLPARLPFIRHYHDYDHKQSHDLCIRKVFHYLELTQTC